MKNTLSITNKIKEKAKNLGFFKIGFACPESIDEVKILKDWIDAKYYDNMIWIEKSFNKRINPKILYPDVKTIISCGINYFHKYSQSNTFETGRISRYALGEDYHIVVLEKLKDLLNYIKKEIKSVDGKIYVDNSPVLEKIWAEKAGIGWIGKNSLVLTREVGSWIFLGEIFLNIPLDYNEPCTHNYCGNCNKCIDACPTGAIVKPYTINTKRCISYLTIEHKGEIPENLKQKIGMWIYGCDVCQEVCPWNKFSKETNETRFLPDENVLKIKLNKFDNMKEKEFINNFKKSPIKRIKLAGLRRNVKIALENKTSGNCNAM